MTRIVQLKQSSAEWLAYRLTMRNASETARYRALARGPRPISCGCSRLDAGSRQQAVTRAMQQGTHLEPAARAAYEEQTGTIMQPLVLQAGAYSASLDCMTLEGELIVEIKCSVRGRDSALWKEVQGGWVLDHYVAQVQHQLTVSGAWRTSGCLTERRFCCVP